MRLQKIQNEILPQDTSSEVLRDGNFSYRLLLQKDREEALNLFVEQFDSGQPLTNSVIRQFPQWEPMRQQIWRKYWELFIDEAMNNGVAIVAYDLRTNKMIAAGSSYDVSYDSPAYQELFLRRINFLTPVIALQEFLIRKTRPEYKQLLNSRPKGTVLYGNGAAIRKEYLGNGKIIVCRLLQLAGKIGAMKGFKYISACANNFKSSASARMMGYQMIASCECREFQFNGVRPFALIEQLHHETTYWLKKIR